MTDFTTSARQGGTHNLNISVGSTVNAWASNTGKSRFAPGKYALFLRQPTNVQLHYVTLLNRHTTVSLAYRCEHLARSSDDDHPDKGSSSKDYSEWHADRVGENVPTTTPVCRDSLGEEIDGPFQY